MTPVKFEHIGVFVTDMDRSIAFYQEVMGLTFIARRQLGSVELGFLELGGQQIELVCGPDVPNHSGPVDHIAFTVRDLEAARAEVLSRYPEAEFEPEIALWDGLRCCFFKGPDGERLELFERKAP